MKQLPSLLLLIVTAALVHAQDIPLSKILVEKEDWRELAKDVHGVMLLEAEPSGSVSLIQRNARSARIDANGKFEKLADPVPEKLERNHRVVIAKSGTIYSIAWGSGWVDHIPSTSKRGMLKLKDASSLSCLTLWPDEGHLVIGETDGAYLWAFRIEKDGSFGPGDRYYSLRTKPNEKMTVAAMTMDAGYLLYACTPLGIQVFDPTGRLSGVIPNPSKEPMTAIAIGGAKADELFIAAGDRIYARRIQGKAIYTLKKEK